MAPAGLWTTPTDLATWALAVADARAGRSPKLLSQATAERMLTEVKPGSGYGIGPGLGGTGRAFHFGHGGANEGFHSELVYYPELGVGAAVMTNGDRGPFLIREVMLALAAEYGWPDRAPTRVAVVPLAPEQAAGLAGRYRLRVGPPEGIPVEIRRDGERLVLSAPQFPPNEELLPESDSRFVLSTLGWRVTFARGSAGRATGLTVDRVGAPPIEGTREP
jgi:CubicO group peptidase (beta-lactamase class C family)